MYGSNDVFVIHSSEPITITHDLAWSDKVRPGDQLWGRNGTFGRITGPGVAAAMRIAPGQLQQRHAVQKSGGTEANEVNKEGMFR